MSKSILLIEDNDLDRELTLQGLKAGGVDSDVINVSDGVEAVEYLFARGQHAGRGGGLPGLILLDLKMPRVDGFEVLAELRRHREFDPVPVVVMTSSQEPPDVERAYDLGCNAYVVKPIAYREFIEAVKTTGVFWAAINEPQPGRPAAAA